MLDAPAMGQITVLARQKFSAILRPGEAVEVMGIGIHIVSGDRSNIPTYAVFGLTSQRLLVLICPGDAWACAPKPEVTDSLSIELAELQQVRVEAGSNIAGPLTRFVLVRPQGEITYVLRHEYRQTFNKWNFGGFDQQQHQDWNQFVPEFLARHVAMGTPRSPQGIGPFFGELHAARANRAALLVHHAQVAAHARAVAEANASIKWPFFLMAGAVLAALIGLGMASNGVKRAAREDEAIEYIQRDRSRKYSPYADPRRFAEAVEESNERRTQGYVTLASGVLIALLGVGGSVGTCLLGVSLNKKKRERNRQAAPGTALQPT